MIKAYVVTALNARLEFLDDYLKWDIGMIDVHGSYLPMEELNMRLTRSEYCGAAMTRTLKALEDAEQTVNNK